MAAEAGEARGSTSSPRVRCLSSSTPSLRADDGIRTRDPNLGKVVLYQLSHVRKNCSGQTTARRR